MELEKIRSLGDEELAHHGKTAAEQLFRLRFQVSLGQNDGVKKLRQLRKEVAQVQTVARERELGIRGAVHQKETLREGAGENKPATRKKARTARAKTTKTVKTKAPRTKATGTRSAKAKTAKKGAAQ
jgi:large subunit ribosomal protein L29